MLQSPVKARIFAYGAALAGALLRGTGAPAPAASEPLSVGEIAPGVFVHQGRYELFTPRNEGDVSNGGFIVGRDGVAVLGLVALFAEDVGKEWHQLALRAPQQRGGHLRYDDHVEARKQ